MTQATVSERNGVTQTSLITIDSLYLEDSKTVIEQSKFISERIFYKWISCGQKNF
jgi:hypothetical protein